MRVHLSADHNGEGVPLFRGASKISLVTCVLMRLFTFSTGVAGSVDVPAERVRLDVNGPI